MLLLNKEQIVIAMSPDERDALRNALEDAVTRYEAADEHTGKRGKTYRALRGLLEALDDSVQ